jgi:hypothetical protein
VYEWLPPDVELMTDVSKAEWVSTRLQPWGRDGVRIASYMPDVFEAYGRLFHPAGDRGGASTGIRWSELASRSSTAFHAEVQFQDLVVGDPYRHPELGDVEPLAGSIPQSILRSLVEFLPRWMVSGERCWFAMWDGNGTWWKGAHGPLTVDGRTDPRLERIDDERDRVLRSTPTMPGPSRAYFLMRGLLLSVVPLFDAAGSQSPNLWWPQSRKWLISTEVDAYSSYVGGSAGMISELVASPEFEALPTSLGAPLDWGI